MLRHWNGYRAVHGGLAVGLRLQPHEEAPEEQAEEEATNDRGRGRAHGRADQVLGQAQGAADEQGDGHHAEATAYTHRRRVPLATI